MYDHFHLLYCLLCLIKLQSYRDLTFNSYFIKWFLLSVLYCKKKHVPVFELLLSFCLLRKGNIILDVWVLQGQILKKFAFWKMLWENTKKFKENILSLLVNIRISIRNKFSCVTGLLHFCR